jgi:hypothetical protein
MAKLEVEEEEDRASKKRKATSFSLEMETVST